ncbi:hypothetical protein [Yinghuangia seranimata]|uniref:hypothetical protein n=1 Tax=Yinghuangia seranimata TaxID=408067 RepID=UPI00248C7DB7|nr:hypothetical protein [Yinghuangia seranimata]MDI2125729.1 hypothetical protein [Yinghuangia seranimata]
MPRSAATPRPISIDGADYAWHVRWSGDLTLRLRVWRGDVPSGRRLHVDVEFFDLSLYWPMVAGAPPERRDQLPVQPVTPGFVAKAVRAALAAGWDPSDRSAGPGAFDTPWPEPVRADADPLPAPEPLR